MSLVKRCLSVEIIGNNLIKRRLEYVTPQLFDKPSSTFDEMDGC